MWRRFLLAAVLCACGGDDGIEIEGTPGAPFPATFDAIIPYATVHVEGAGDQALLFDSGSPITILDTSAVSGLREGRHALDLATLGVKYRDAPVAAWDLPGGELGGGLFGADLIRHFPFTLDYRGERIWFGDGPDDTETDAAIVLRAEVRGGGRATLPGCGGSCGTMDFPATRLVVKARFEDQAAPVWVILDSGASGVVVTDALYATLGDERPRLDGLLVGTVEGDKAAFLVRVWRLELQDVSGGAGAAVDDLPIIVVPGDDLLENLAREAGVPAQALVGGHYLRRFLTTLDYPGEALRLAPYRDTSHIDPDEFVGVGFDLTRDGDDWYVLECYPGHDAYEKGLRPGDRLDEIDGMPLRAQPGEVVDAALAAFAVGDEVPITYRRITVSASIRVKVEDLLPHLAAPARHPR